MKASGVLCEVAANSSIGPGNLVAVEVPEGRSPPDLISRLGPEKIRYLGRLAGLVDSTQTLELFGGSNLSTAIFANMVGPSNLFSVDLRYPSQDESLDWWYRPDLNYSRYAYRSDEWPQFVSADARNLPFDTGSFDAVIAPDSPRSSAGRFDRRIQYVRGSESGLSDEEQMSLFLDAASEAHRVLKDGGTFVSSAPLSWAQQLWGIYRTCTLISHADIDPSVMSIYDMPESLRFQTQNCNDPVVYVVCQK